MIKNDLNNALSLSDVNPEIINWRFKDEKGKPVCNFSPVVISLIKVRSLIGCNDFNNMEDRVRLQLNFNEGESVQIDIQLAELGSTDWPQKDKRCIVNYECKNASKFIENYIRSQLEGASTEVLFKADKLGISRVDNDVVFIAGDRVITRSSAPEPEDQFILEQLPFRLDIDTEIPLNEAFEGMKQLICLSPEIGRVLIAHVISGFIRMAFKEAGLIPCAVLVIVGESGMLKSHYVPQLTQLYNRADGISCNTRFNSTQCFIEDMISEHSECTVVIDDLHTAAAGSIKKANETTAEEIVRRISDDIGRGHKSGNSLVQKKFGGNVVFIGEYIIGRESTMPRALVVNLTKKIDGVILDKYQRKQPLLVSTFYYYFIQWYVEYYEDICQWIDERITKFRETTVNSDIHGRLRDTEFYLQISYMIFLEFCKDSNFISTEDVQDEYDDFKRQLHRIIREQQERYKPDKAKQEKAGYLKIIRKLYKKGKFRLADSADTFQEGEHDGLIHYECLCIRREKLEKRLHKISPDIKIDDVINQLVDEQALKLDSDKRTVKISKINKSVGGIRFYAIKLKALDISHNIL